MKKITATARKYWYLVAIAAFIIGVGSITGAKNRATQIAKDPANAVTK